MARKLSTDLTLLSVTVARLGFGLLMVWSSSSALAQERYGSPYYFLVRQAVWSVIGLAAMVAALRVDYRSLRRPGVVYALAAAATLCLIVVLFLEPVNDTHRWIRLGALSFQPAELAKLAVVLFLATRAARAALAVHGPGGFALLTVAGVWGLGVAALGAERFFGPPASAPHASLLARLLGTDCRGRDNRAQRRDWDVRLDPRQIDINQ